MVIYTKIGFFYVKIVISTWKRRVWVTNKIILHVTEILDFRFFEFKSSWWCINVILCRFRKIIFKMIWFGLWQNFKCMAKFENSRWPWWSWDRMSQWDFEIFDDFERYETQIKSITNWIWFEIALIYWKPLFECNWTKF